MIRTKTLENYQSQIDTLYGAGNWIVVEYTGSNNKVVLKHRCGSLKTLTRAKNFLTGKSKCKDCEHVGRPKTTFKNLDKRVKEATYNTYELVALVDSNNFTVNHKSCRRAPFKTSISRFFSRGQRCQCSKRGVVGRKPND